MKYVLPFWMVVLFSCSQQSLPDIAQCRTFQCLDSLAADSVEWGLSGSRNRGVIYTDRQGLDSGFVWNNYRIDSVTPDSADALKKTVLLSQENRVIKSKLELSLNEEGKIISMFWSYRINPSSFYIDETEVTGVDRSEYQDTSRTYLGRHSIGRYGPLRIGKNDTL